MGPRGKKGDEGTRGRQGPPGPSGTKGEAGPPGANGLQGPSGSAGSPGNKGDTGARGSQGSPGPKGASGSFGRNWKQCVFKNLDEHKDSGLIKVKTQFTVKDNCEVSLKQIRDKLTSDLKIRVMSTSSGRMIFILLNYNRPGTNCSHLKLYCNCKGARLLSSHPRLSLLTHGCLQIISLYS